MDTQIAKRDTKILKTFKEYGFVATLELNLPPARLETLAKGDVIGPMCIVVSEIKPEIVYTVYRNEAHSDHEIVFEAIMSATKPFRYPFVKKVLAYETMSETDFSMKPEDGGFKPNVFVDIEPYLEKKLDIWEIFESDVGDFPFPRSIRALKSLAFVRATQCNAEAFILIKEIL